MKTYLNIDFKDKDAAVKAGARWDPARKAWFCPDGVDLARMARWLPGSMRHFYNVLEQDKKRNKGRPNKRARKGSQCPAEPPRLT